MSRYRELLRKIAELEKKAGSGDPRIKWTDRDGNKRLSSFKVFAGLMEQCPISMENGPLSKEDCPILEMDTSQLVSFPEAQQMFLSNQLVWLPYNGICDTGRWAAGLEVKIRACHLKINKRRKKKMTVSEQIIEEYLKKGKSLKDVPPELKDRLNENGISKLYKALVENDIIDPVEIDEEKAPENDESESPSDDAEEPEDDEAEEKPTEDKEEEPAPKRKSKFEDVWKLGQKRR